MGHFFVKLLLVIMTSVSTGTRRKLCMGDVFRQFKRTGKYGVIAVRGARLGNCGLGVCGDLMCGGRTARVTRCLGSSHGTTGGVERIIRGNGVIDNCCVVTPLDGKSGHFVLFDGPGRDGKAIVCVRNSLSPRSVVGLYCSEE